MDEETEFTKLPIEERCLHKLWKARVNGYEEAAKQFQQQTDEKHPEFNKYLGLVKKFVVDSNAAAQEKGLVAVLAYVENAAVAGKSSGEVMNGIVTKCLGAPRTKTKEIAVEIALMYIEIEKQEVVQDELIKGLDNKTPKIVTACISVLREALRLFGIKIINIKPLIKLLPKLLEDRDKAVRDETKMLAVEIYRWIKDAIKPPLQSLKPVQLTELEVEFSKVALETPVPTRYLRSQQAIQSKAQTDEGEEEVDVGDSAGSSVLEAVDPYEFMEPVNLLAKLPKDFYEQVEAKKWQERKDALEALLQLATSPKLEAGDYGDLVRTLKKLVSKDTNVLIVALSGKCLAGLATGLRKKFHPYAGQCVQALLEKFKEKKQNVVTALREAMDAIYLTTTLEAILEDIQAALDNKNPQIKLETANFLARTFTKSTPFILNKKLLKPICASLTKTLNDTDPVVRDNSSEALGTAMKVVGEKSIMPFMQDVDAMKLAKVKEMCEKAVVVAAPVAAPKAKAAPPTARVAPAVRAAPVEIPADPATRPTTAPAVTGLRRPGTTAPTKSKNSGIAKPGVKGASAGPAVRRGGAKAAETSKDLEFMERELTDEEVQMQAEEILSADIINGLGSSVWKDRLTAMEKFNESIQGMDKSTLPAQLLVKLLSKKPGFKENNVQILKLKFDILSTILANGRISRSTVNCCLSDLVDKIGDAKNGSSAMTAITAMAEAVSLDFITSEVLQLAFAQKNPKNQVESLNWLGNALKEFGFKIQVKGAIEYLKKGLAHTNPSVRTSTISLLGVMYMYMGRTLRTLFEDEKPTLLQQIDAELAKVQDVRPPPATRGLRKTGSGDIADQDGNQDEEADVANFNASDLLPRVDLSEMISQTVLTEMEDKNWKVRAEALQKVSNILSEAKFITPDIGDLPNALKSRLTDSNKNLAVQALNICQSLGTALGPHCSKHIRTIAPGLLVSMGDLKNNVRSAAVSCLNTWLENCSVNCLFEGEMISDALKTENPTLRQELLGWLSEKLPTVKSLPASELNLCLPYLYSCLEDRNADVRKKAQDSVLPFMIHLGYESLVRSAGKLKPASKAVVTPLLDKARPYLPAKPAPSAKSKQAAPVSPTSNEKGSEENTQGLKKIPRSSSRSKIASKNAGPGSAGSATTRGAKKEGDEDTAPPLVLNNQKDQRMIDEKSMKVLRWNFTTPREEFYTLLRDQMMNANWGPSLVNSCFSNDFKQHLKALDTLLAFLPGNLDVTTANLDLILKWLALRFFDTNPSVLLKGLEYLQQLFPLLAAKDYKMTELEASSFIPYLILKIGDPKDPVRKGVHDIIHQIFHVYPATRVFVHTMQGLSSKNARQRAECLEELGFMIERFGLNVCQPSPAIALKEIAKQISDRDNGVRTAALNCAVQAYYLEGEKVYKYVGHLSDKDMSLLEERIKRSAKIRREVPMQEPAPVAHHQPSPPAHNAKMGSPTQQAYNRQQDNQESPTMRIHKIRPVLRPRSMGPVFPEADKLEQDYRRDEPMKHFPPTINVDDDANELLNMPDVKLPKTRLRPTASAVKLLNSSDDAEMALNLVLAQLAAADIPVVVEAFAQVEEVLRQEDKAEAAMSSRVDQLLLMGALQYRMAYAKHMADENICKADVIKLYRCVTMTLTTLFGHTTLPKKASRDVLRDLIPHLVTVILDSRLNELLEGPQVVRSLNMLVIRILQKGNPTQVMSALIKLLFDCVGNMSASERHTELIMKCLWKMLRMMDVYINELNVDHILLEVHQFLKMYPSSFWKDKKEKEKDTPLRTIKTLLFHLVQHKGEDVLKHLVLIPNRQESDLVTYLNKMLHSDKSGSSPRLNQDGSFDGMGNKKSKHSPMRLSKTNHENLAEIFKKIGDKEHTKEGLQELYEFRKKHPSDNIEPFLQKSSEFFQNYIRRGLNTIEQEQTRTYTRVKSQSMTYTSTTTNTFNSSGSLPQDTICVIPPIDATPVDYIEYLKTLAARLQIDGSKYSDPILLQQFMENARAAKENEEGYKEDVEGSVKAFEEMKTLFEKDSGFKIAR